MEVSLAEGLLTGSEPAGGNEDWRERKRAGGGTAMGHGLVK